MELSKDIIFENNILLMKSLVGKCVKVNTLEEYSYVGIVYVIDPIYKTIVLHSKQALDENKTVFIFHHAIESLEILSDEVDQKYLQQNEPVKVNSDMISKRNSIKKWLEHMFIETEEVGDYLKIQDHLIILPPYGIENCVSNNTIILNKIRNVISLMPSDFS